MWQNQNKSSKGCLSEYGTVIDNLNYTINTCSRDIVIVYNENKKSILKKKNSLINNIPSFRTIFSD